MPRDPGSRRPTLKDLAREAGVSLASASYAVNGNGSVGEQTRAHILSAAERIGYRGNVAARVTRTGRSGTLALVVPDMTNPFFPSLAQMVFRAGRDAGFGMFLVDTEGSEPLEQKALAMVTGLGVDGVVWFPIRDKDTSAGCLDRIPTVVLDRTLPGYDHVGVDYLAAGRIAARHLIDRGHRRIGMISGPCDVASMRDRCAGAQALIEEEAELAFRVENAFSLDLEPQVAAALDGGGATAVFAAADVIALGAIRHLTRAGKRVPEDVSVLGFDDIPGADQSTPPLSTLEIPVAEIGQHAIDILVRNVAGGAGGATSLVQLDAQLVVRESVAAPPL
ncbi:LacI family DNA-binding transcriptional regulator [Allosphingosinicella deserti]|uniref:LacI family transcriptional regulator n=1 Tax=Allosphingosinicella deserti TaxID=2116704 RepID=A0A2P7QF32_9SPHN|nr:LacI family DNA-binding transcriptional regulator [Sphingomonas deserti]PSJ36544.1 LacI family transcriptional regulator [Sphingomonas deserti]